VLITYTGAFTVPFVITKSLDLHVNQVKGELGELQIYFIQIPLHQQKFLVVLVLF